MSRFAVLRSRSPCESYAESQTHAGSVTLFGTGTLGSTSYSPSLDEAFNAPADSVHTRPRNDENKSLARPGFCVGAKGGVDLVS